MTFTLIDIANDPWGRKQFLKLGVPGLPVVTKGSEFDSAADMLAGMQLANLEQLSKFLGLEGATHIPLSPQELFHNFTHNLRTAQRYFRQLPNEQLHLLATHNRKRSIRIVSVHAFTIGQAYLDGVVDGARDVVLRCQKYQKIEDGTLTTGEDLDRACDGVVTRLEQLWVGLADKSCQEIIEQDTGAISMHQLFERTVWHSAHHTRKIAAVLERLGIAPNGRLDLTGLSLPQRIWD